MKWKQNKKLEKGIQQFFDKSYKNIFENKIFAESLIKFCLPLKLVNRIDWESLKTENTNFAPKDLKSRVADELYSIQLKNGEEIYIYFLVEFQTTVDKQMALRLFIYIALIYHHLLKMGRIKRRAVEIPIVIPIVLYIGDTKWNASVELKRLMDKEVYSLLKEYIPGIKYILIDKNRYTRDELTKMRNVISGLLYLEKMEKGDVETHIKKFWTIFVKRLPLEAKYVLENYLKTVVERKFNIKIEEDEFKGKEVIEMVTTAIDEWREELLQQGLKTGRKEGLQEGLQKGFQEGLQEGLQKGLQKGELNEKLKIAKKMLAKGFKLADIINITGLTESQIIKFRKKIRES